MFCCFKNCFTSPTVPVCSKFLGRGEGQAAGLGANGRKRFAPVSRTMGSQRDLANIIFIFSWTFSLAWHNSAIGKPDAPSKAT